MQAATTRSVHEHIRGRTLLCDDVDAALFPGAVRIGAGPDAMAAHGDESADSIVVIGGLMETPDPIQTVRAWRRVLKEGGSLVFAPPGGDDPPVPGMGFVLSLVNLIGGFVCVSEARQAIGAAGSTLVFVRRRLAEIRNPLGVLGPVLAAAAAAEPSCRVELLFQVGVILLQGGEAELARSCFERMLRLQPGSGEGHFGLGMALAATESFAEALIEFECARRLDPNNAELLRWLELTRARVARTSDLVLPASVPHKWSPASAPTAAETGAGLRI